MKPQQNCGFSPLLSTGPAVPGGAPRAERCFGTGVAEASLTHLCRSIAPPVLPLVQPHLLIPPRPGDTWSWQGGAAGASGVRCCRWLAGPSREPLPRVRIPRSAQLAGLHPAGKGGWWGFKPLLRGFFAPSCYGGGLRLAVRLGTRRSLLTG